MDINEKILQLAQDLEGTPINAILQVLAVFGNELQERGELVACALYIAMAAREVGNEDELHNLLHKWDLDTRTTERLNEISARRMNGHPLYPSHN